MAQPSMHGVDGAAVGTRGGAGVAWVAGADCGEALARLAARVLPATFINNLVRF